MSVGGEQQPAQQPARWAQTQDENFTTEAFAHLLRHALVQAPEVARSLLRLLFGAELDLSDEAMAGTTVTSQWYALPAIPDIKVENNRLLALVEVKVGAELTRAQAEDYLALLDGHATVHQAKRLAVLTRDAAPPDLPESTRPVRWFEIGDALEEALRAPLRPVTHYLLDSFHGFLVGQGLTLPTVRSGVSEGVRRHLRRAGDESVLRKPIKSPAHLTEDPDLRPLHDLLLLMRHAVEQVQQPTPYPWSFGCGQQEGGWIGYNLGLMAYFFYLPLGAPEIVRFQAFEAPLDPNRFDGRLGRLVETYGRVRWEHDLDLGTASGAFFQQAREQQLATLHSFLGESLQFARSLEPVPASSG